MIASSDANGSSSSSTGLPASSVRRKATRWRIPPDSAPRRARSKPASPNRLEQRHRRVPRMRRGPTPAFISAQRRRCRARSATAAAGRAGASARTRPAAARDRRRRPPRSAPARGCSSPATSEQQRRLAAAAGPDHGQPAAGRHLEADVVQRRQRPVAVADGSIETGRRPSSQSRPPPRHQAPGSPARHALDLAADDVPGRRNTGGSRNAPTPAGVPVAIRSPGCSVKACDRCAISCGMRVDHLAGGGVLHQLVVHPAADRQGVWVAHLVGADQLRAQRREGVQALGPCPLAVAALQVTRGDVVHDRVAGDVLPGAALADVLAGAADHDHQLRLPVRPARSAATAGSARRR